MTSRAFPDTLLALRTHSDCAAASPAAPPAVTAGWQGTDGTWHGAHLCPLMTRQGVLVVDVFVTDEQGRSVLVGRLGLDRPRVQCLATALLAPTPTGEEIWGETPEADLFPLGLPEEEA